MSSSDDDQIQLSQVLSPHLQQHPVQREAVIGEWQRSHRTPICREAAAAPSQAPCGRFSYNRIEHLRGYLLTYLRQVSGDTATRLHAGVPVLRHQSRSCSAC
ncbi:hypothetical protein E2C01_009280 [Portunus trituberculatus]|uniref:Uncharacterized protein n=1 Tax=Portunus trituberculatus TaxID=210409 RepID=A0A5B7D5F5_PORTR|nr:hypothetical protein [Portunus trituberculatus]